jgi:thymidylate synthase ThyX
MIPILDKGWIKLLASSLPGENFDQLLIRINRNKVNDRLLELPNLTLEIRCPLFVQMYLAEHGIKFYTTKTETKLEAYIPTVADIGSPDLATSESVATHITQTTEALILNNQMYQDDKCDRFIAQVNSPVSVYNTIIGWANLRQWIDLISQRSLPKPIEEYRSAISSVLTSEWPNLPIYLKQIKK